MDAAALIEKIDANIKSHIQKHGQTPEYVEMTSAECLAFLCETDQYDWNERSKEKLNFYGIPIRINPAASSNKCPEKHQD